MSPTRTIRVSRPSSANSSATSPCSPTSPSSVTRVRRGAPTPAEQRTAGLQHPVKNGGIQSKPVRNQETAYNQQYLATNTRTPYVAGFDQADAGKTAADWLRWENTQGETGPWSAVASATITG